jgi:hypothetical protein
VYRPVSNQDIAAKVAHFHQLYRDVTVPGETIEEQKTRIRFLRNLVNNLQHNRSQPSPRLLAELTRLIPLTIGGAFELIGYNLDDLRSTDFLLNGHRTRIIEHYHFDRDCEVDIPDALVDTDPQGNLFLSEMVLQWRTGVKLGAIRGARWRPKRLFYAQIGIEDNLALSGLPPGAIVSVEPFSPEEPVHPLPTALYFLQISGGFLCCSCEVLHGRLILHPRSGRYRGPFEFAYPEEARIVGIARAFAVRLPALRAAACDLRRPRNPVILRLPWEQSSLGALLHTNRMQFGLSYDDLDRANEVLIANIGTSLSRRTVRRYQHGAMPIPHTGTMLALAPFHAARISDVMRLLNMWNPSNSQHSLATWLKARSLRDLPLRVEAAPSPRPPIRWKRLLDEWGEWPALLSVSMPHLLAKQHGLLRLQPAGYLQGLDPLVQRGAIALLEEEDRANMDVRRDQEEIGWNRSLYAIRHGEEIICGHLFIEGQRISLIPHPRSSSHRRFFLRQQVMVLGRFVGLASPLPTGLSRPG